MIVIIDCPATSIIKKMPLFYSKKSGDGSVVTIVMRLKRGLFQRPSKSIDKQEWTLFCIGFTLFLYHPLQERGYHSNDPVDVLRRILALTYEEVLTLEAALQQIASIRLNAVNGLGYLQHDGKQSNGQRPFVQPNGVYDKHSDEEK